MSKTIKMDEEQIELCLSFLTFAARNLDETEMSAQMMNGFIQYLISSFIAGFVTSKAVKNFYEIDMGPLVDIINESLSKRINETHKPELNGAPICKSSSDIH